MLAAKLLKEWGRDTNAAFISVIERFFNSFLPRFLWLYFS